MGRKGKDQPDSAIGTGIYTLGEAARLAQTSTATLKRWLKGYRFPAKLTRGESPPIFHAQLPELEGHLALGFLDLVEVLFIKAFRTHGVTLQTIRRAASEAARRWGTEHPFCVNKFRTDGRSVFATVEWEEGDEGLVDLAKSQLAFEKVLNPYLRQVEYDLLGAVARWWPLGRRRPVVLDPKFSFGKPIVVPWCVPTEALYRAIQADQTEREVARWFEIPTRAVRAAMQFEETRAA